MVWTGKEREMGYRKRAVSGTGMVWRKGREGGLNSDGAPRQTSTQPPASGLKKGPRPGRPLSALWNALPGCIWDFQAEVQVEFRRASPSAGFY